MSCSAFEWNSVWLEKHPRLFSCLFWPRAPVLLSAFFPRLDGWRCLRRSALRYLFLKRPGVISAFMCLRSQLDTVSCHLPIICDKWQVHKHPLVSVLYAILGFIRGCRGNRVDIRSKLPSKEYPWMVLEMKSWTSWTLCLCFSRSARTLAVFMSDCK